MAPVRFYGGPLNALSEGFAAGSEGFARNTLAIRDRKRQAEQDAENKRRYEEDKARATDLFNRQVANDTFQHNLAIREDARAQAGADQRTATTQSARDIGAMAVLGDAPEGQMGPHDPEHEQALGIARNLTPESLPLFLKEHEQIQRTKMLGQLKEKHLSQWQDMTRNPALGQLQGAGHVEEIMARAQAAQEAISGAQTPEQLQEALKTSKEGLEKTTVSIGQALDKQNQMLRVAQHYRAGPHGIAEQQAALGSMPAGIREFAQKIVDDQDRLVSAFEAGAITSGQLTTLMEHARNQKPQASGQGSKPAPFDELKTRQYLINLWKEQNPDEKNDQGHVIKQGNPVPSGWLDRETQRMRGIMGAGPEVPPPSNAPLGQDPDFQGFRSDQPGAGGGGAKPWESHPVQVRQSLIEEAAQDMATNGAQGFEQIVAKYGVDGKLPEGALRKIIQRAKALKTGGKEPVPAGADKGRVNYYGGKEQPTEGPF